MNVQIKCPCPPKPAYGNDEIAEVRHPNGDTVILRDTLEYAGAMTVRNTVRMLRLEGANVAQALAGITEAYLLVGISGWSLQDDKGKPIEVSNETIRSLLSHLDQAMTVSDAADELYQSSVMLPLVNRDYGFSVTTPTPSTDDDSLTSPTNGQEPKPRKPSKRSSTTTSRTAVTEATSLSLVGVSNSSESSQSAA